MSYKKTTESQIFSKRMHHSIRNVNSMLAMLMSEGPGSEEALSVINQERLTEAVILGALGQASAIPEETFSCVTEAPSLVSLDDITDTEALVVTGGVEEELVLATESFSQTALQVTTESGPEVNINLKISQQDRLLMNERIEFSKGLKHCLKQIAVCAALYLAFDEVYYNVFSGESERLNAAEYYYVKRIRVISILTILAVSCRYVLDPLHAFHLRVNLRYFRSKQGVTTHVTEACRRIFNLARANTTIDTPGINSIGTQTQERPYSLRGLEQLLFFVVCQLSFIATHAYYDPTRHPSFFLRLNNCALIALKFYFVILNKSTYF